MDTVRARAAALEHRYVPFFAKYIDSFGNLLPSATSKYKKQFGEYTEDDIKVTLRKVTAVYNSCRYEVLTRCNIEYISPQESVRQRDEYAKKVYLYVNEQVTLTKCSEASAVRLFATANKNKYNDILALYRRVKNKKRRLVQSNNIILSSPNNKNNNKQSSLQSSQPHALKNKHITNQSTQLPTNNNYHSVNNIRRSLRLTKIRKEKPVSFHSTVLPSIISKDNDSIIVSAVVEIIVGLLCGKFRRPNECGKGPVIAVDAPYGTNHSINVKRKVPLKQNFGLVSDSDSDDKLGTHLIPAYATGLGSNTAGTIKM